MTGSSPHTCAASYFTEEGKRNIDFFIGRYIYAQVKKDMHGSGAMRCGVESIFCL